MRAGLLKAGCRRNYVMDMLKLSIIIPTLNEEKELPSTFETLKGQTFKDFEVIVADSPKTADRTREVAKAHGARIAPGGPVGFGRNSGAEHALAPLLLFLDADVVFPNETFLEDAIREMKERKLDVAAPDIAPISDKRTDKFLYGFYNHYVRLLMPLYPHAPGFCMFATKKAHEAIGGFDAEIPLAEDHDYIQRAKRKGFRVGILDAPAAIPTSVRRFEKDGRFMTAVRYVWTEIRMMLFGPYRKKLPFRYEMGGDAKK
jgi:glycosyltransferase involved in cell wall biosynthesis